MRRLAILLLPIAVASTGCAGVVSGGSVAGDADASSTTFAVMVLERLEQPGHSAQAEANARFARVTTPSTTDDALLAIGAGLDLPAPSSCGSYVSLAPRGASNGAVPPVELINAGEVAVESADSSTRLVPRQVPDVTDVVTGVVYARVADAALFPSAENYVVHVAGTRDLDGFDVSVRAPADPKDVHIGGELDSGALHVVGSMIDFWWGPTEASEVVYVDVMPSGIRCVLGNSGRASMPTSLLADSGVLTVHRLHRELFRVPGVDSGEVRFDFARAVAYEHR